MNRSTITYMCCVHVACHVNSFDDKYCNADHTDYLLPKCSRELTHTGDTKSRFLLAYNTGLPKAKIGVAARLLAHSNYQKIPQCSD